MSHLTNLHGHEIEQKSEAWRFNDFLQPCFGFYRVALNKVMGLICAGLSLCTPPLHYRTSEGVLWRVRSLVTLVGVFFSRWFEDSQLWRWSCAGRVFGAASRPQHVGPNSKNKHLGVELVPQCEDFNEEHVELAQTHSQRKLNPSLPDFPPPFHLPSPLFSPILCNRLSSTMG